LSFSWPTACSPSTPRLCAGDHQEIRTERQGPVLAVQDAYASAEILTDYEHFDEAFGYIDRAIDVSAKITEDATRMQLQGYCKKIKGKVYYFSNQYENAETMFKEAEQLFRRAEDAEGLAAVYNNLGVLAMFQGEWDKTEELYTRSLELEKKRYNLNGISVCYNNLGGCWKTRATTRSR
jgi:tetratricopeptide (TPR) repeat protein